MMYLSEISLIRHRGVLSLINSVTYNFFCCVCLALAATLPFDWLIQISVLPSCLFLLLVSFIPESPNWLTKKGRFHEAENSLQWLRGAKYKCDEELEEMEIILKSKENWKANLSQLKERNIFGPVLPLMTLIFIQSFSGTIMITDYAIDVFRRADVKYDHYVLSIMCTGFATTGYFCSTFLTTKLSRKFQFNMSGMIMAINLLLGGITFKIMESGNDGFKAVGDILLPLFVILACFGYGIGIGPIPFALLGEILPQNMKAMASALVLTTRHFSMFVLLKFFPLFATTFGLHSAFWFHTGILSLAIIFAYFAIPETRGKTLTELSVLFAKKSITK